MGNCCRSLSSIITQESAKPPRQISILLLGLDGAGKTEVQHVLRNKQRTDFTPTNGCNNEVFMYEDTKIQICELGGAQGIRDIWKHYYPAAHGSIFLIDSTDHDRLVIARNLLSNIFLNSKLCGKPILVLSSKQDLPGAIDYLDFCSYLDIEHMANLTRTPCFVATLGKNDNVDLHAGMRWLLKTVLVNYRKIHNQNEYFLAFTETTAIDRRNAAEVRSLTGARKRKSPKTDSVERPKTAPSHVTTNKLKSIRRVTPIKNQAPIINLSGNIT